MTFGLLASLILGGDIIASGTSACPSPQMVSAALSESLADHGASGAVRVDAAAAGTLLSFTDEAGVVRTRLLPEQANCEEQAARAVVVFATWLSTPPGPALAPVELEAPPLPPPVQHEVRLGLAPLLGWDAQGPWVGGRVDVSWHTSGRWLGWRAQALGVAPQATSLGPVQASWVHGALGVSAVAAVWRLNTVQLLLDAGPLLSLFTARGSGLSEPERDWAPALAGSVGARATWSLGAFDVFADLRALSWLRAPRLHATVADDVELVKLPQSSLQLALGVAFAL